MSNCRCFVLACLGCPYLKGSTYSSTGRNMNPPGFQHLRIALPSKKSPSLEIKITRIPWFVRGFVCQHLDWDSWIPGWKAGQRLLRLAAASAFGRPTSIALGQPTTSRHSHVKWWILKWNGLWNRWFWEVWETWESSICSWLLTIATSSKLDN